MYKLSNSRLFFVAIIFFIINMTSYVEATIINVPDDFTAIQDGINATSDGDTVLVQPGIYYENLHFGGHNTALASLYLTTGDTFYISQTIIDGDSAGTVILFDYGEDRSAMVTGFTIRNGAAGMGAGIFCSSANPTISHNIIMDNFAFETDGGYGGNDVRVFVEPARDETDDGRIVEQHLTPAQRPTNCTFGGPDLADLYISSIEGHTLVVKNTGLKGYLLYPN